MYFSMVNKINSMNKTSSKFTYVGQALASAMDNALFNEFGLKSELAMEIAGQGVAHAYLDFITKLTASDPQKLNIFKSLIFAGPGSILTRQRRRCSRCCSSPFVHQPISPIRNSLLEIIH